jgi:cyclopropane fatty-acyl-phospholipid synthase-like methyltransferase
VFGLIIVITELEIAMADSIETNRNWLGHWSSVRERVGEHDHLRQVERTVGGQPMDDLQIELCVQAIQDALGLQAGDALLDLCCGNGLITLRLSSKCARIMGVDFSEELIRVARQNFAAPNISFIHSSATEISGTKLDGFVPSKVVMCTALQYFTELSVRQLTAKLKTLGAQTVPIFFTDVPDVDCLRNFYKTPELQAEFERRRAAGTEAIGTWWSKQRLTEILAECGYAVHFEAQDARRYGAHYRFDLLATPST